jgi:hypothetical protein
MIFAALQDTGAGTASASRVEGLRGLLDPALIVPRLLEIGVALVAGFLAYRVMRVLIRRLIERPFEEDDPVVRRMREQRARTVGSLIGSVVVVIIVAITTLTILSSFIDIGPLLASVGVLGLAISFGAQSLVKDVITGTFMMLEGQFGVGDVLRIGDVAGSVEAVSLRTVTLRDSRGVVHIIPNGEITRVSNLTKRWSRALLDIGVGYREDVGVYACGPTVYRPPHIGNFRTFVFNDLLHRYLEWKGFDVTFVMNLTDVEDKIIRGRRGGASPSATSPLP